MKKLLIFCALCVGVACYTFWRLGAPALAQPVVEQAQRANVTHLGIIMDGNRRWARKLGLAPWLGHRSGVEPVKEALRFCLKHGISYLTLYAFSLENFKRAKHELDFLFNTLAQEIASNELGELLKQGVRVRFVGDRSLFPAQLVPVIDDVEQKTRDGARLVLTLLFCYGGQQEIMHAVCALAREVEEGKLKASDITQDMLEAALWTGKIPPPDLIIRTGGMKRLSNFLPFQSAYSELYFLDTFWPDISLEHLEWALDDFSKRKRTYGG